MKNTKLNLVHFISALSFSLLILSVSAQKTNLIDAGAILVIQASFKGLNSTLADPCLPTPLSWVTCNSDAVPRIIALNCGNKDLIGVFVDFSVMDALEIIDFSNNHLTQDFPDFLAEFPKLKELNLADNNLFGTVPTSLQKNKDLKLKLSGNKGLCYSDEAVCGPIELAKGVNAGSRINSLESIIGTVISALVMFWFIV
ncbi:putative leucine-rich repeat receptor-like serine/threonine-protein kinase At2g19230 [Papaver somniferum]|nr:putative leucine-rich repeat receptor-like serine/threonine-protein kinase At2g19230 [Papaver somniferum]